MWFRDIVFPDNNEQLFISRAKELGITKLCFVYPYETDFSKVQDPDFDVEIAVQVGPDTSKKKSEMLRPRVRFCHPDAKHLRRIIEGGIADVIYGIESLDSREHMHHRNAGLTQVTAKLLKDKRVVWGISFRELLHAMHTQRVRLFGRVMANMKLQKKYGFDARFASFAKDPEEMRPVKDLQSVLVAIGADEKAAKEMMIG